MLLKGLESFECDVENSEPSNLSNAVIYYPLTGYSLRMQIINKHIQLFQSLFKGRTDIYAKRWEKEGRSGYMPAYDVDWEAYEKHKAQGGTFQNLKDKTPAEFTSTGSILFSWSIHFHLKEN